jgi:hypothetical protein
VRSGAFEKLGYQVQSRGCCGASHELVLCHAVGDVLTVEFVDELFKSSQIFKLIGLVSGPRVALEGRSISTYSWGPGHLGVALGSGGY